MIGAIVSASHPAAEALVGLAAIGIGAVLLGSCGYEEPALRRRFGPAYERYRATVGRWLPRRPSLARRA
jgi:protein-S-isoprenylcysteine O-methyltransferase Ste14